MKCAPARRPGTDGRVVYTSSVIDLRCKATLLGPVEIVSRLGQKYFKFEKADVLHAQLANDSLELSSIASKFTRNLGRSRPFLRTDIVRCH